MVRNIIISFLFIFYSCSGKDSLLPERDRLGNQVVVAFGKKMQQEGLQLIGIGGAEREEKTWLFCLVFYAHFDLTIPKSRKLLVKMTDEFLQLVNTNEQLRPYLSEYPFTDKNLEISVIAIDDKPEFLFSAKIHHSNVYYTKANPNGGLLLTEFKETYDEAVQRVKEEAGHEPINH